MEILNDIFVLRFDFVLGKLFWFSELRGNVSCFFFRRGFVYLSVLLFEIVESILGFVVSLLSVLKV